MNSNATVLPAELDIDLKVSVECGQICWFRLCTYFYLCELLFKLVDNIFESDVKCLEACIHKYTYGAIKYDAPLIE